MFEKILIVDDEPENLQLVSFILSREGFQVTALQSGREALNFLEKEIPHLIILDVMMPEIDGFQICRLIRQKPQTAHIPVLLLTALTGVEQRIKGFESGADVFLSKPFEPEELLARVKVLLKRISLNDRTPQEDKFAKNYFGIFHERRDGRNHAGNQPGSWSGPVVELQGGFD